MVFSVASSMLPKKIAPGLAACGAFLFSVRDYAEAGIRDYAEAGLLVFSQGLCGGRPASRSLLTDFTRSGAAHAAPKPVV